MIPLQTTILYSADSYPNEYWTLERNTTEWSVVMAEFARSGNKLQELMLEALVPSLKDAHVGTRIFFYLRHAVLDLNLNSKAFLIHTHFLRICSPILPYI